jgi:LysM repeat protein
MSQKVLIKKLQTPLAGMKFKAIAVVVMLFSSLLHASETFVYLVKPNDTLTKIAARKLKGPVYKAKKGSLQKLLALNPNIKDPNHIFPGQKLTLVKNGRAANEDLKADLKAGLNGDTKPVVNSESESKLNAAGSTTPANLDSECAPNTVNDLNAQAAASTKDEVKSPPSEPFEFAPPSALRLKIGSDYEYLRLDTTDLSSGTTSTFLFDLSQRYELQAYLDWQGNWSPFIGYSTTKSTITPEIDQTFTFVNNSVTRNQAQVGIEYRPFSRLLFDVALINNNRIIPRASTLSELTLDKASTNTVVAKIKLVYLRFDWLDFDLAFQAGNNLSGSSGGYSFKPGIDERLELGIKTLTPWESLEVRASAFLQQSKFKTETLEQTEQTFGAGLNIQKRFDF